MKNKIQYLLILACLPLLMLGGCSSDSTEDPQDPSIIEVGGQTDFTYQAEQDNFAIAVKTNVHKINVKIDYKQGEPTGWLQEVKTRGLVTKILKFKMTPNTSHAARHATITLSARDAKPQTLNITQEGDELQIKIQYIGLQYSLPNLGEGITAKANWGDGSPEEDYQYPLTHDYKDDKKVNNITIHSIKGDIKTVRLNDVIGVKSIDLSKL